MSIDFDLIKRTVTAEEAASAYGLDVNEHHKALCPWHKDSHPSLSFKGSYCYCFTCHRGGSCIDLTMQLLGVDAATAARTIAQDFAISGAVNDTPLTPEEQRQLETEQRLQRMRGENARYTVYAHDVLDKAERVINQSMAAEWDELLTDIKLILLLERRDRWESLIGLTEYNNEQRLEVEIVNAILETL